MAKREIVINQKQYKLPARIDAEVQLEYLDAVDALDAAKNYRRAQYDLMAEQIVKMYGDQFTVADVYAPQYGLTLSQIMVEFSALEAFIYDDVDKQVQAVQANFTQTA